MITRLAAAMLMLGGAAMAAQVSPEPTFNKDVLPILQKNCQTCHRPGQLAPMSFLTYQSARPWAKAMKAAVVSRKMPPWFADPQAEHILNNASLKQADIDTIANWADAGAPEGDMKDAPPAVQWPSEGWQIKPDIIVEGPDFKVPAKGVVEWTNITVPGPFKEDTWVTSMELLPGDRTVTHHICITFKPPSPNTEYYKPSFTPKVRDEAGNEDPKQRRPFNTAQAGGGGPNTTIQFCYLPGSQFDDYRPFGAGKLIPAGTDISFGLHYTPNGKTEVLDHPRLGFTVSQEPPKRQYINYIVNATQDPSVFAIPPNNSYWEAPTTEAVFEEDVDLVWVASHMHVRGKDTIWELTYPDGQKETILSIKNYDYNWQLGYQLKPKRIPKGTKLTVKAWYDNSPNNRANPDPNRTVYWGDQAWEEMMSAFVAIIANPVDAKKPLLRGLNAGAGSGGAGN
jgi:hypothetical protein